MPQFRKKPVVIEAVQWDGKDNTARTLMRWSGGATYRVIAQPDLIHIKTHSARSDWSKRHAGHGDVPVPAAPPETPKGGE